METDSQQLVYFDHATGDSNLRTFCDSLGFIPIECAEDQLVNALSARTWRAGLFHVLPEVWEAIRQNAHPGIFLIRFSRGLLPARHDEKRNGMAMNCVKKIEQLSKQDVQTLGAALINNSTREDLLAGRVASDLSELIPKGTTSCLETLVILSEAMLAAALRDPSGFHAAQRLAMLKGTGISATEIEATLQKELSGLGRVPPAEVGNFLIDTPSREAGGTRPAKTEVVIIREAHQALVRLLEG